MEVDSVARYWISLIVEDESSIHDGLRMAVGRIMGMFYADDGIIGSWDPEWIQVPSMYLLDSSVGSACCPTSQNSIP